MTETERFQSKKLLSLLKEIVNAPSTLPECGRLVKKVEEALGIRQGSFNKTTTERVSGDPDFSSVFREIRAALETDNMARAKELAKKTADESVTHPGQGQ